MRSFSIKVSKTTTQTLCSCSKYYICVRSARLLNWRYHMWYQLIRHLSADVFRSVFLSMFHYLLQLSTFSVLENVSGLSMHISGETSGWMNSWAFKQPLPSVSMRRLLVVSCASRNSVLEGFQSYMCIVNATDQNTKPVSKYPVLLLSVCVSAKVGNRR